MEVSHRLPFPAARLKEEPETIPEVVATRPQPKLPSDRRLERERERGGEHLSGPSPGSSATYSPAVDGASPVLRLDLRTSPQQAEDPMERFIFPEALSPSRKPERVRPSATLSVETALSPPQSTTEAEPKSSTRCEDAEEMAYLRKNVEHLCFAKRRLEEKVQELESRCTALDQRKQQYKLLYEQALREQAAGGGLEISSLHQQLSAVSLLKDALNQENMELSRRLEEAQRNETKVSQVSSQAQCVICMDNLANVVCLPCKHLATCSFCGKREIAECPLCRTKVAETMQIFTP